MPDPGTEMGPVQLRLQRIVRNETLAVLTRAHNCAGSVAA
jgi:hypothetical protein